MNIIDHSQKRKMQARAVAPKCAIIHNTGQTDSERVLRYYLVGSACPNYVIDHDGTVHKIVADDKVAWHIAYSKAINALYDKGQSEWQKWRKRDGELERTANDGYYQSWVERWPGVSDPRELVGPRPNYSSVGIELMALHKPTPRVFSDEQYVALVELLSDVCGRLMISPSQRSIFGHSDADPISRFNSSGSWDPGATFDWDFVRASLKF